MNNVNNKGFEVIQQIYDGDICIADKQYVNPKCDKLWSELSKMSDSHCSKVKEACSKANELIALMQIECFAKGAKFMSELIDELKKCNM